MRSGCVGSWTPLGISKDTGQSAGWASVKVGPGVCALAAISRVTLAKAIRAPNRSAAAVSPLEPAE